MDLPQGGASERSHLLSANSDEIDAIVAAYQEDTTICDSCLCMPFVWVFHLVVGLVGFICLVLMFIISFIGGLILSLVYFLSCCACCSAKIPSLAAFIRRFLGDSRLGLEASRHWNICLKLISLWHVRNAVIGFMQIIEYARFHLVSTTDKRTYMHRAYSELYNGNYPFIFNVLLTDRPAALENIYEKHQIRAGRFGGMGNRWAGQYPFIQALNWDADHYRIGHDIAWEFVHNPYTQVSREELTANIGPNASKWDVIIAFQEITLYYQMGIRLSAADMDTLNKTKRMLVLIHYPDACQFLLCGGKAIRHSFAVREWTVRKMLEYRSPRLVWLKQYADANGFEFATVVRAAAWEFLIAGGLLETFSALPWLEEDVSRWDLIRRDPVAFAHEYLRRNTAVPLTGHLLQRETELVVGGSAYKFQPGVCVGASLTMLDNDPAVWKDPDVLAIDRDMSNAVTFGGLRSDTADKIPRLCPGYDYGVRVVADVLEAWVKARDNA